MAPQWRHVHIHRVDPFMYNFCDVLVPLCKEVLFSNMINKEKWPHLKYRNSFSNCAILAPLFRARMTELNIFPSNFNLAIMIFV